MTKPDKPISLDEANAAYRCRSATDFMCFIRGITIDSQTGPQLFNDCMTDFQREFFEAIAKPLEQLRLGQMPDMRRFWVERTKKASKDADIALCLLWVTAFAIRPFLSQVGAADRDQAAIVKRRIEALLHYNEWLNELVVVHNYTVSQKGPGLAVLDIMASDIAGSHGETPDLLVINEMSHVTKFEFIENLMDNADGVAQGIVICATNAGFAGTKAAKHRKNAIDSDNWSVHLWQQPAPWHSQQAIEDAKRRTTLSRYNRLWWGKWASGKGDAMDEDKIDRCFNRGAMPLIGPEPGWVYGAGLDLGVSHDHSGLLMVGVNVDQQRIKVGFMRSWKPPTGGEIDLMDVENACLALHKAFNLSWLGYDPHQAKLMAQRLAKKNVPMREVTFTGKNLDAMANTLKQVVDGEKLECFDDAEGSLRRDFGKFNIVEKSYGLKLESVSDEYGHADVGTALIIVLLDAVQLLEGFFTLQADDVIAYATDGEDLTEEELEEMPDELKDIYQAYDDVGGMEGVRKRMTIDDLPPAW